MSFEFDAMQRHYLQRDLAAIDAGADLIMGHHAHSLKGIEMYEGRVIFHSPGNFVTWLPLLALKPGQDPDSWARRRIKIFGFKPDPEYPTYPFHPDAKYTLIAKFAIENRAISRVSYIPCLVNKQGYPEVLRNDNKGQEVFDYVEKITKEAELNGRFEWAENEILIST
jgi:poly-gamma-glutamate synthesis protein (capsule biosynthesis protein)